MSKLNALAWEVLNEDERLALSLELGLDKSTWEAGEVMKKAHYKYLEIAQRGKYFLKIFTEHFTLYDELIPDPVLKSLGAELCFYFKELMCKRKPLKETAEDTNAEYGYTSKGKREAEIIKWFTKHGDDDDLEVLNFINLIKEFDRWNNFRILPKEIQEPSAFKRRNKNLHRKHIKVMSSLPPLNIDIMRKMCSSKIATGFFACIIPTGENALVFNVKPTKTAALTRIGMYLWKTKEQANEYGELVYAYTSAEERHCRHGLDFWPKYRELIKRALNYEDVHRMAPSRRYLIMAMSKLEFYGQH